MSKKIRRIITLLLSGIIVFAATFTVHAKDISSDYIFVPDTETVSYWQSESTGWCMIPYYDVDLNEKIVLFAHDGYGAYFMEIADEDTEVTEQGGFNCWGTVYDFNMNYYGYVEIEWNSMESIDFPAVYILYGNNFVTDETTMATADYTYAGTISLR